METVLGREKLRLAVHSEADLESDSALGQPPLIVEHQVLPILFVFEIS
jgi:hypothetical protein